ncbi:MAG TPA: SgcJ/EcaC family oxidoreductase [Dehalococcoidia bacterium]|nr:SgcJ/EcaC family oxidoreductase [Dehalococcoidia bacterium]
MADAISVVRDFCAAWDRRDKEAILAAFTDDAVYHNMPMEPAKGKDQIKGLLDFILPQGADGIRFDIKRIAADGDSVLTERVDTFTQGSKQIVLEVMGAFEVRDGKIAAWRDYFDMARWTKQAGG